VAAIGGTVVEHAPEVAGHVRQAVSDAVSSAVDHGRSSDLPAQVKNTTAAAQDKWSAVASDGLDRANEAANQGKELLVDSLARAKDAVDRT
jgi:hypothetical protein